nr:MFS transporter [Suttonella ornithocola]
MPLFGYLCDRYGTQRVFVVSMALFIFGSLLCAAAPSLSMLVFGRVVQGMGGAMLMPVPRLVIMRAYPKDRLLPVMNYVVTPALLGPVLGPLVGGYLVDYASWHWIFLINVPIGLAGLWMTLKLMPNFRATDTQHVHLDYAGFLLFSGGAAGLTLFVETILHPASRLFGIICAVAGGICLYLYWQYARRAPDAIYAPNLWKVRTYRLGISGSIISRLGMNAVPFLLPLLLQVAFGYDAVLSGWMLAPIAVAAMIGKSLVAPLMKSFGYRKVLVYNTRIIGTLIALLALPNAHTPLWMLLPLLFIMGLCNSIQFTAMNTLTLADLRDWQAGSGNSLMAVNQQLGISFGIALGALLLNGFHNSGLADGNLHRAFQYTFIIIGMITFTSGWVFAHLHQRDGENLVHR